MNDITPTEKFWIHDIGVLFRSDFITRMIPSAEMTSIEKYNAITRFVILFTIIGFVVSRNTTTLLTGITTIVAIIVLNYTQAGRLTNSEGFGGIATSEALRVARERTLDPAIFTQPTPENPAMNVMPADIYDTPGRPSAAPASNPDISDRIESAVKDLSVRGRRENNNDPDPKLDPRLYQDMEDQREFEHSMRVFHPTANTQIPDDQGKFADFLYGNMTSCKSGDGVACMRNNQRHINM